MKDIRLTRVAAAEFSRAAQAPAPASARQSGRAARLVERSIELMADLGNRLYRLGAGTPDAYLPAPVRKAPAKRRRAAARARVAAAGRKAAATASSGAKGLRTPVGKLAVVQTAAMACLFAYVGLRGQAPSAPASKDAGAAAQAAGLQRYLPSVAQYVEPAAFDEKASVPSEGSGPKLDTWVTPWNLEAVRSSYASYASLSAFWLSVGEDGSSFVPKAEWTGWDALTGGAAVGGKQLLLTVTGTPESVYPALSDPQVQRKHIDGLLQAVTDHGFSGIDIDYEGLGQDDRELFTAFINNLAETFHQHGKTVSVTVEARLNNDVPLDWHAIGSVADQVRVMAYDYHSRTTAQPGPIGAIGWVKETVDYAVRQVDPAKLVIGLGNYGYDWIKVTADDGGVSWQGSGISFEQAMALADERKVPVVRVTGIDERGYDVGSVPTFTYADDAGNQHAVWFEDNASLQEKVRLVRQYPVAGIIFWSVGLGDGEFWDAGQDGGASGSSN